jgi:zinc-ribbon domain
MEVRFCPRCGASRLSGAMFCGACGLSLGTLDSDSADAVAPPAATAPPAQPAVAVPIPEAATAKAPSASPPATPPVTQPGNLSATASLGRVRARRRVVNGFVRGGALLAAVGILLPLLGAPRPATGLAPIGSTVMGQPLDYVPLVGIVALVVIALACVAAWTRDLLDAGPALATTATAGFGVIVLAVLSAGRLGYDAGGGVLPAVSLVVAGGASIIAAALVGAMIRE